MAHPEQANFCTYVRNKYPEKFRKVDVLDVGSLDINGNNRYLFENYKYTGVDIGPGKNVDVVSKGHEYNPGKQFDVVISTECFEHDMYWEQTIANCIQLTKSGGIFLFTCATEGRPEHGTTRTTPQDSPFSHVQFNEYYKNLTQFDVAESIVRNVGYMNEVFTKYLFDTNIYTKDLYFYGIKK